MISTRRPSTHHWLIEVGNLAENVLGTVDHVDAVCNVIPYDTCGHWASDLTLVSIELRGVLARLIELLAAAGMTDAARKIQEEQ